MPAEADLAGQVIDRQLPGGAGKGQQGIAQHQRAQAQVCGGQRQRVERGGLGRIAEPIAGAQQHMAHGIAHAGIEHGRNRDLHRLLQEITLRRFRHQLDQGVAAVAGHGHQSLLRRWLVG